MVHARRGWSLGATLLLAGCIGGQGLPPGGAPLDPSLTPVGQPRLLDPPASLPPLDSPGALPYEAPAFEPLPPEAEAGRWERMTIEPQPTAPPSPTPVPRPSRLPGEPDTYVPLQIHVPEQKTTLNVGDQVQLATYALGSGPLRWGVLEPERATVSDTGLVTVKGAGPVRVYVEQDGHRHYVLFAVRDPAQPVTVVKAPFPSWMLQGYGTWGTFLRSRKDWEQFASLHPSPPPPPEGVDFDRQTLVVACVRSANDGESAPVVTRLRQAEGMVVEVVAPDAAPLICTCVPSARLSITAVPRLPEDARLELVRLREQTPLPLVPVTGPTPTPAPSLPPTPDPFYSLPPGAPGRPPAPPYTPPPLSEAPGPCPAVASDGTPPFSLTWYDHPTSSPWEPLLTPGGSLTLVVRGETAGLGWRTLDPRMATVDRDGRVTALRPGAVRVQAVRDGSTVTAMIPSIAEPAPALRFRFRGDWATPKETAPRGARILRTQAEWETFWKENFLTQLPWQPPAVDFERHDVVVLVEDRWTRYTGGKPVLTHVSDSGRTAHLVFGGIANPRQGAGYYKQTFMFLTGKLAADATVRVHTLCNPEGE